MRQAAEVVCRVFGVRKALQKAGKKNMLHGGLWCIGGILVTFLSYRAAASSPTGGEQYVIESMEGDPSAWTPLATLTNDFGTVQFVDPAATNGAQRFYRAVSY